MYLALKNLKIRSKKRNSGQKAKSKARTMYFEFEMQQHKRRGSIHNLNCQKKKKQK